MLASLGRDSHFGEEVEIARLDDRLLQSVVVRVRVGQQRPIELRLSASEFLDRIALLVPPPRKHRHHYFGVLAPNSPWRALVKAQAGRKLTAGSKAPRPKPVREVAGATRPGQGAHLRSSAVGAAGGCTWLGSSQSRRRCGRYWNE